MKQFTQIMQINTLYTTIENRRIEETFQPTHPNSSLEDHLTSKLPTTSFSSFLEDVRCQGGPGAAEKEISMPRRRIDQTPVNFDPVEPQTRYSPPLGSSVRAYNYRRHANPGTLQREREREKGGAASVQQCQEEGQTPSSCTELALDPTLEEPRCPITIRFSCQRLRAPKAARPSIILNLTAYTPSERMDKATVVFRHSGRRPRVGVGVAQPWNPAMGNCTML